jgi:hypothetical protein
MRIIIPESWDEVSVAKYTELMQVGLDYKTINSIILALTNEKLGSIGLAAIDVNEFDKVITALSILLDVSEEELMQFEQSDLITILQSMQGLTEIKQVPTGYNYNSISVGRWINIEEAIKGDASNNIALMLSKLLDIDVDTILAQPITKYYSYVIEFGAHRKDIYSKYENLFISDEDAEDTAELTAEELRNIERAKKWNWYGFIYAIADGDFNKMHEVVEHNFIGALNFISYRKQLK